MLKIKNLLFGKKGYLPLNSKEAPVRNSADFLRTKMISPLTANYITTTGSLSFFDQLDIENLNIEPTEKPIPCDRFNVSVNGKVLTLSRLKIPNSTGVSIKILSKDEEEQIDKIEAASINRVNIKP